MLSTKLHISLRANSAATRSCISNNDQYFKKQRQFCKYARRTFLKTESNEIDVKYSSSVSNTISHNGHWMEKSISTCSRLLPFRAFATQSLTQNANIFGNLGDRKYERVEMDEVEKEEEKFTENEAKVPRKLRLSPGQYAMVIKSHIQTGDLPSALSVLDAIKDNRDKPTYYIYNLLIRAFAVEGDLKTCFKLYSDMRKRNLKVTGATYTSLLNVCGNSKDSPQALEKLRDLRKKLLQKGYTLNEANFNAMIKAYGRHNCILEAFQVADEMRDNRVNMSDTTFNCLLHAAISDERAGARHAITIWHLMQCRRQKPNILTYNLLLRAFRDCELGDIKVNDVLIPGIEKSKIELVNDKPDLLAFPPVLSTLVVSPSEDDENIEQQVKSTVKGQIGSPQGINLENALMSTNNSTPPVPLTLQNVNDIFRNNRLLLFGGLEGILSRMEKDNLMPNATTITLLMELIPPTNVAEKVLIHYAKNKHIALDVDFYNMLIRKRSIRFDYESAREVLYDMQKDDLQPTIITWGVLALGCRKIEDVKELLEGMKATGHSINIVIAGTLLNSACRRWQFNLIIELLDEMSKENIRPNRVIYHTLETFYKYMNKLVKRKEKPKWLTTTSAKKGFKKFNLRYNKWLDEMEKRKFR